MNYKIERSLNKFEIFLLIFIALQPIIDVLTSLSIELFNQSATIGVFMRFFVMLLSIFYILSKERIIKRSPILIYLISLFIILLVNFSVNLIVKDNFIFMQEAKFIAKIVYTHIMLFAYIILIKSIGNTIIEKITKFILYSILVINAVMIISVLTNTSFQSYDYTKIGYSGWFFAGNEIGAIIAMLFPIIIALAVNKTRTTSSIYYWIPVVLTGVSLLLLGTKVGYGALIIGLIVTIGVCFINWFMKKDKRYLLNGFISFVMLIALILLTPLTPIYSNTFAHLGLLNISLGDDEVEPNENDNKKEENGSSIQKHKKPLPEIEKEQVENLILSSREDYLRVHKEQFKQAPLSQKLFGMGYAGNYTGNPKMIEMDFHDIFFSLGIIGFIVYFLPFLFYIYKIGISILKKESSISDTNFLLLLVSLCLGLGISFTAGHVLTAPAVSIYLGVIIALLFSNTRGSEINRTNN